MSENLTFEFEDRPTIKGFPELRWTGKRPYRSTQYYPAQLREKYGEEKDGWINKIFWGDNLQVMSHLMKEYRGQIDLIYIDPPFDSKADYKKKVFIKSTTAVTDNSSFEEKQYGDIWTNDEYLQFMYERLLILRELLSDKGTIYLHCDYHKSHHLRCLLDEVFGADNFFNEIIWQKIRVAKAQSKTFGNIHDIIFAYSKTSFLEFNEQFEPQSEDYISKFNKIDPITGKRYQLVSMLQSGQGPSRRFGNVELYPGANRHWIWSQERIDEAMRSGDIEISEGSLPRKKQYYDETKGKKVSDIWTDIFPVNSQALESENYPTQKPESLLERIIRASSNPGDIVFDCFMGSGTTQAVAMKLGRKFIGADINLGAIQTTTKRLINVTNELKDEEDKYTGFEVYNVNNYDFFRNPVEARELIIEALEIQAFPQGNVWDGELDGRMVKIMPVTHIATKADLEELKANIPYKTYEKRKEENPNKPVENITIVCMGHEPDLKVTLEQDLSEYKFDIQIVDILRDKSDLQLKREAEAEVVREGSKLVVRSFYPMNLLQKLSLQKEYVEDWRQLVESIMIDWNYDGVVMQPTVMDIPDKKTMVTGVYDIPEEAGNIKVKITDLLSESLEVEV
jgi:site-specific DNA-methyltransferase (adenine-specific)/adenine-specific DNA-methyltransferase